MKKYLVLFNVLFAVFCFSGCSSDDENTIPQIRITDEAITDFFKTELPERTNNLDPITVKNSFFFTLDSYGIQQPLIDENIVCVINSRQELADAYLGEEELPEINFNKYTLIIGQQIMPYHGFYVVKKELSVNDKGLILTLYTRNDNELLPNADQNLYFWGLYPKQSQKMISVNVIKEYTHFPDLH